MDVLERMKALGIDVERSAWILRELNAGRWDALEPVRVSEVPEIDGATIIDRTRPAALRLPERVFQAAMADLLPDVSAAQFGSLDGTYRTLPPDALERIGVLCYPLVAFGVLNGGSATSYADETKNRALNARLLAEVRPIFDALARQARGKPKGITPAVVNPDGSAGPAFLELRFRALLLEEQRYRAVARAVGRDLANDAPVFRLFEMTSAGTAPHLPEAYRAFADGPFLAELPGASRIVTPYSAVQPLLAAITHSEEGRPRRFFDRAWGRAGEPLGIPGGHGQSFDVLAETYRRLREEGVRFAYLSNVDNLGALPDPISIARLALSDAPAGFDFAFRTPVDVKGGVLIRDQNGALNCADIGPAISRDEIERQEADGRRILFNCATGLFRLDHLVPRLASIADGLPMRISDQVKDAGRYAQAEQVTWEVIAMLDRPLIFGVDKYERFLAAKMLLEPIMGSGVATTTPIADLQPDAPLLAAGMRALLETRYGLALVDGRWRPRER